jgi:hypothetical protein
MIEISLSELNRSNFYEKTLQTIEQICDDFAIEKDFGSISMANQMICDYLDAMHSDFSADVDFRIDSDEITVQYSLQNGNFNSFASNEDGQNTALFVLQSLADEISFSTDLDTLISTFHVKTKMSIQRQMQHQEVRKNIFKYS